MYMKNNEKPLTKEQLTKYKPEDQAEKMNSILGIGLENVFNQGIADGTSVVAQKAPTTKAANVDALPSIKK